MRKPRTPHWISASNNTFGLLGRGEAKVCLVSSCHGCPSILILAWCRPGQEESRNGHRPSWGKLVCVDLFVTGRKHQWRRRACLESRKFRPQRRGDTVAAGRDGGGMEGHFSGARAVWHGGGSGQGVTLFVCNVRLCGLVCVCVVVW
jgi:hypothetical protein